MENAPPLDDAVKCKVCPRRCVLARGAKGFCGVRQNQGGAILSLNYGRPVAFGVETIETEAIYHYAPGARILAIGNAGCNLACSFCQNWLTSQASYLDVLPVRALSPADIVDLATQLELRVLSWTYNEPVVWHEFVLDTARLAQQAGLLNLYKSAFFITVRSARELIPLVDLFSISVKSANPEFYEKLTGGWLQPILKAAETVHSSGRHLEISNLLIPGENTSTDDIKRLVDWVTERLSPDVPLHFVRFHPDYQFTHVPRTPVETLMRARNVALARGVKHVYLGNAPGAEASDTHCAGCGSLLVRRFGTQARVEGLDGSGACLRCGRPSPITRDTDAEGTAQSSGPVEAGSVTRYEWRGEIPAVHVEVTNPGKVARCITWHRFGQSDSGVGHASVPGGQPLRFLIARTSPGEDGVVINYDRALHVRLFEVYDRAHLPSVPVRQMASDSDAVPLPRWSSGHQQGQRR